MCAGTGWNVWENPSLPITGNKTLGKSLDFSQPTLHHLQNGGYNASVMDMGWRCGMKDFINRERLSNNKLLLGYLWMLNLEEWKGPSDSFHWGSWSVPACASPLWLRLLINGMDQKIKKWELGEWTPEIYTWACPSSLRRKPLWHYLLKSGCTLESCRKGLKEDLQGFCLQRFWFTGPGQDLGIWILITLSRWIECELSPDSSGWCKLGIY